jgi:predicted DsbA family dithiol-disulfide isomerase
MKAVATAEWVRHHEPGAFDELQRMLFEAHFALEEDIGNRAVIDRHAATAGADVGALHTASDGSAYAGVRRAEGARPRPNLSASPETPRGHRRLSERTMR